MIRGCNKSTYASLNKHIGGTSISKKEGKIRLTMTRGVNLSHFFHPKWGNL